MLSLPLETVICKNHCFKVEYMSVANHKLLIYIGNSHSLPMDSSNPDSKDKLES